MGQEGQVFSISNADLNGKEGSAINYDSVLVALPVGAITATGYDSLVGAIPRDPKDALHSARYCVKKSTNTSVSMNVNTNASVSDKEFDLCTGDPNCNGGPEPKSAVKRVMEKAVAKVKRLLRIPAKPPFGPGTCQILLAKTVIWSTGRVVCLTDKDPKKGGCILVCASTDLTALPQQLTDFCNASGLEIDFVAFHIYEVSLPAALISAAPNLSGSSGQLLAVPVRRGRGTSATQVMLSAAAVAR